MSSEKKLLAYHHQLETTVARVNQQTSIFRQLRLQESTMDGENIVIVTDTKSNTMIRRVQF